MVMSPKIATCCYCGTRAALRLDKDRHELTCRNCGAPLRNLKQITFDVRGSKPEGRKSKKRKKKSSEHYSAFPEPRRKPKKPRKSMMSKVLEEAFDVIEDIFD